MGSYPSHSILQEGKLRPHVHLAPGVRGEAHRRGGSEFSQVYGLRGHDYAHSTGPTSPGPYFSKMGPSPTGGTKDCIGEGLA